MCNHYYGPSIKLSKKIMHNFEFQDELLPLIPSPKDCPLAEKIA